MELCRTASFYLCLQKTLIRGVFFFSYNHFLHIVQTDKFFSYVDGFGLEAEARMTTWHIMIPSDIKGGYSQDVSEGETLSSVPSLRAH